VPVALSNQDNTGVLGWQWVLVERPIGSLATIAAPNDAATTFTPDVEGTYLVFLATYEDAGRTVLDDENQVGTAVLLQPPLNVQYRIPAAGETTEFDAADGWAAARNPTIKDLALHSNIGHFGSTIVFADSPYLASLGESVQVNTAGGIVVVQLPPASVATRGRRIWIKDVGRQAAQIAVTPDGAETIDSTAGAVNIAGTERLGESIWLESDGAGNWKVLVNFRASAVGNTLAQVLVAGNVTGGRDIVVSDGDHVAFETAARFSALGGNTILSTESEHVRLKAPPTGQVQLETDGGIAAFADDLGLTMPENKRLNFAVAMALTIAGSIGAANTVLKSDGTHNSYDFVRNVNVAADAAIAPSKIAPSGTNGWVLTTVSGVTTWAVAAAGLNAPVAPDDDHKLTVAFNGDLAYLDHGTANQFLTSGGVGSAHSYQSADGDVTGNANALTVAAIHGVATNNGSFGTPTNNGVLFYDGTDIKIGLLTNPSISASANIDPAKFLPGVNGQVVTTVAGNVVWANLPTPSALGGDVTGAFASNTVAAIQTAPTDPTTFGTAVSDAGAATGRTVFWDGAKLVVSLLTNQNLSNAAAIAISKLAASPTPGYIIADVAGTPTWIDPALITPSLSAVLAVGNTTGANDIDVSSGRHISFASEVDFRRQGGTTNRIASSASGFTATVSNTWQINVAANERLTVNDSGVRGNGTTYGFISAHALGLSWEAGVTVPRIQQAAAADAAGQPATLQGQNNDSATEAAGAAILKGGINAGAGDHGTAKMVFPDDSTAVGANPDGSLDVGDPTGTAIFDTLDADALSLKAGKALKWRGVQTSHYSTAADEYALYVLVGHASDPDGLYVRKPSDGAYSALVAF
jgi:hypothetical protein